MYLDHLFSARVLPSKLTFIYFRASVRLLFKRIKVRNIYADYLYIMLLLELPTVHTLNSKSSKMQINIYFFGKSEISLPHFSISNFHNTAHKIHIYLNFKLQTGLTNYCLRFNQDNAVIRIINNRYPIISLINLYITIKIKII